MFAAAVGIVTAFEAIERFLGSRFMEQPVTGPDKVVFDGEKAAERIEERV